MLQMQSRKSDAEFLPKFGRIVRAKHSAKLWYSANFGSSLLVTHVTCQEQLTQDFMHRGWAMAKLNLCHCNARLMSTVMLSSHYYKAIIY